MTLWVFDLDNAAGTHQILELPAGTSVEGLTWTPDGRGVALGLMTRTGDVMLAERAGSSGRGSK